MQNEYFKNLTDRERAIFEGGISMGSLFHQFVGTPVSMETYKSLEKAIENSISIQPKVINVKVSLDTSMIKKLSGSFGYTSLTGDMLNVEIITEINDTRVCTCIEYIDKLDYPLMYIKD